MKKFDIEQLKKAYAGQLIPLHTNRSESTGRSPAVSLLPHLFCITSPSLRSFLRIWHPPGACTDAGLPSLRQFSSLFRPPG